MPIPEKNDGHKKSAYCPRFFSKCFPFTVGVSYKFLRFFLFHLWNAESAHDLAISSLKRARRFRLLDPNPAFRNRGAVEIMGLKFPNVVGLAAGMDKAAACVDGFGSFGFGHIEVGTLTPRPQPGNPRPRVFRLTDYEALINRLGFNNPGIETAIENLRPRAYTGILGINIGKNFDTPNERAHEDYLACLRAAYPAADYVTVNLSSPNTVGLRDLQEEDACRSLLECLKAEQKKLAEKYERYVPIAIKIAPFPDLASEQLDAIAKACLDHRIDGIIATNTTIDRKAVKGHRLHEEKGGLSGRPLTDPSTEVVRRLNRLIGHKIPIIGVGGIMTPNAALDKLNAGASLVQLYTGLIFRGPRLVRDIIEATAK